MENTKTEIEKSPMNYCTHCGYSLSVCVPPGDELPRHVCKKCGVIHYENPKMVVGTIPQYKGQILSAPSKLGASYGVQVSIG